MACTYRAKAVPTPRFEKNQRQWSPFLGGVFGNGAVAPETGAETLFKDVADGHGEWWRCSGTLMTSVRPDVYSHPVTGLSSRAGL